jgi:hypothetical protein
MPNIPAFFQSLASLLALTAIFCSHSAKAASEPTPNAVVQEFYTAHFKDFDSTGPGLRKKEKWLSKGLLGSIHAWIKRSAKNTPKGDAPELDIDLFTEAQDQPYSFKLGSGTVKGAKAEVPISFSYGKEVILLMEDGAWKIDDLQSKENNLRKLLDTSDLKKWPSSPGDNKR